MPRKNTLLSGSIETLEDHRPLSDRVYNRLQDAIIDGRLAPGQWLRQEALAQELGTSQLPVREAIRRLAAEGLAVRIPYKGVQVAKYSPVDITDMLYVRMVLEGLAARFATQHISSQEISQLEINLEKALDYSEPEQMEMRRELNKDFHLTICRASKHQYLIRQIEAVWVGFPSSMSYEGMRRQEDLSPERLEREHQEHRAILAALKARNPDLVEKEIQDHIKNLTQEFMAILDIPTESLETPLTETNSKPVS